MTVFPSFLFLASFCLATFCPGVNMMGFVGYDDNFLVGKVFTRYCFFLYHVHVGMQLLYRRENDVYVVFGCVAKIIYFPYLNFFVIKIIFSLNKYFEEKEFKKLSLVFSMMFVLLTKNRKL